MHYLTLSLRESVLHPERRDKPHRRLSMTVDFDPEDSAYLTISCKDENDRLIMSAEIPVDAMRSFLKAIP